MVNDRYYLKCITFGRAKEGLRADFQRQLKEMQQEIGFEYIRFHGLFHDDMAVYDEDENGNPILWFGYIDKLFDFLLSVHIKPFVELSFMPLKIATVPNTVFWWKANGCPPTDYEKWHYLVQETVKHLTKRYGEDEVKTWYFEVWNEPNLSFFFQGTKEEYFKLYQVSVDAVKSVCKEYRVGGPSSSGADFREELVYVRDFIKFCKEHNLPVDFISAHPYPTYWPLDVAGNQHMGYMKKEVTVEQLDHIREIVDHSPYADAEIHLTEWSSSPSSRDLIHDTPFLATFIIHNITHNFGKVDSIGFWTFTDIIEENGPGRIPFHGGFGLINADGVKKPGYWAYWMLSKLGDEVLEIRDDCVVTKRGDDYQVILYNFCYYKKEFADGDRSQLKDTDRDHVFDEKEITVDLKLDLTGEYEETVYELNQETSAVHNWIKMGAPQYPSLQQIEELKESSQPLTKTRIISEYNISQKLAPHEVKLYLLRKMPDAIV